MTCKRATIWCLLAATLLYFGGPGHWLHVRLSHSAIAPCAREYAAADTTSQGTTTCHRRHHDADDSPASGKPTPTPNDHQQHDCPICFAIAHAHSLAIPIVCSLDAWPDPGQLVECVPAQPYRFGLDAHPISHRGPPRV